MRYIGKIVGLTTIIVLFSSSIRAQKSASIYLGKSASNRIEFGAGQLQSSLAKQGIKVSVFRNVPKKPVSKGGNLVFVLKEGADSLKKEGYSITSSKGVTTIVGADGSGALYGCVELADNYIAKKNFNFPAYRSEAPEMVLRGTCIGVQKPYLLPGRMVYEYPYTPELFPWLYDKQQWIKYLDMLVHNKMNSVYLWNGHPFASLVKLPDYPFAVEVDDATFKKNEEIFKFITDEADKRGIFVIQMFYNILVSKPFAEHYKIKTQDRNRQITPLLSDYTRKSIAAFVEKYSNVGLLVCLGEAMNTYDDDVEWFTKTIIPGVKDGLKKLGRTDEPPILVRAHDTDCKMVMDASLPLYKNLYTMHKYNGESLTTYQPRGPWSKIHKDLSSLGSIHISNVHILANLEPFRWSSPDFIQRAVTAMHAVHGANALHLYPQASYWDYPYTADKLDGGKREEQLYRDWMWYKAWARYAWKVERNRSDEADFWNGELASFYGTTDANADLIRKAFEQSGEIAPKLLRRFGITEGNRQCLLLGMFASQLINPYKYTVYPGFYESCGPEGEKLIEYVEKEWKFLPHEGELPLDIIDQVMNHGDRAVKAIDAIDINSVSANRDEFERLKNDIHCYREFAYSFAYKVMACKYVLDYQWGHRIADLDKALPLFEKSLEYYKNLVSLTNGSYLYANSMQTTMRRIPITGENGKNKHWSEMLVHYQNELDNFKKNIDYLKKVESGEINMKAKEYKPLHKADIKWISNYKQVDLKVGTDLFNDRPNTAVEAVAPELDGLTALQFSCNDQRNSSVLTAIEFETDKPVKILVGYFKDEQDKYAQAPKLEIDATANEYGQAEPYLSNSIRLANMPLVNVHAYHFGAGHHKLNMPNGFLLVLGATNDELEPRNVGLNGGAKSVDWLFY